MPRLSILLFAGLMLVACSLFKAQDGGDTDTENTVPEVTVTAAASEPTSSVSAKKTVESNLEPGGVTLSAPNSTVVEELESVEKYLGAESLEERIVNYPTVVRATLDRVTTETIEAGGQWEGEYVNIVKFHLTVGEYLNGRGGTNIIRVWGSGVTYVSRSDAEAARRSLTDGRDTRWDDLEAIFFLEAEPWEMFSAIKATGTYFISAALDFSGDDFMSIHSRYTQLWLPIAPSSTGTGDDKRFLLDAPVNANNQQTSGGASDPPTITLRDLKAKIAGLNAEIAAGDGSNEYLRCVQVKYRLDRVESHAKSEGREITLRAEVNTHTTTAGTPAHTVIYEVQTVGWYPDDKILTTWLEGGDAALFEVVDGTEITTRDRDGDGELEAGVDWILYQQMLRNVRPLPGGTYSFTIKDLSDVATPCNDVEAHEWTVSATAPENVLHELLFDPVTVGEAIAADDTNGVLKPAAFTDGDGSSATIEGISYEAPSTGTGQTGTVKVEVDPHDTLSGQIVDIIELDGTVSLSLNARDATVDEANDTLSWSVASAPWENGDKLMVRIRRAPP